MKSFIVFAVLIAAALATPINPDAEAAILRYDSDNIGVDGYSYGVETSNGIVAQEEGRLADVGTEDEGISVRGQFSYPGPDGVIYTVTYTAGKEGFVPVAAHLPTSA